MVRTTPLLALALTACTSADPTDDDEPIGPTNYDVQIDGLDDPDDQPDTTESHDAHLCVTPGGATLVAWLDDRDGFTDVWLNRSDDDGDTFLDEPIRVKQGPGNASGLHLSCDGGRVFVAWEDDRDGVNGYTNVYVNVSTDDGATWLDADLPVDADPDGIDISLGPQVVQVGDRVHVVWYDQRNGAPDVLMATSTDGGLTWGEPVLVSVPRRPGDRPGGYWSGNPRAVADEAGRVYVVWEDTRNGPHDLYLRHTDDGETFGPLTRIDVGDEEGAYYSFAPRVAASGGHVYVVWHDTRGGEGRDVMMNHSADSGDTWLPAGLRLESDPPGFSEGLSPELVVDGPTAHVVWQDDRDAGFDIYYRRVDAGVPAEVDGVTDLRLDRDTPGYANSANPVIAHGEGTLVVAWRDFRNDAGQGFNDLLYNLAPADDTYAGWSEEDYRLDSFIAGGSFTEDLSVAVHGERVLAAWVDGRNGSRDIYFSQTTLGTAVPEVPDQTLGEE